ncbi:MAG: DUF488 domain-containing protein [Chloroflexi bacterium]|nr:DUF488 domain-containing protein [Chloroflexota bacterium]
MSSRQGVIFTVGSSTRDSGEFIHLLKSYGIEVVVDVRRFPTSRIVSYKKDNLSRLLAEFGLSYLYLGEELGGYRSGGYEAYTATGSFQQGLRRLEEEAAQRGVVVMCAERFPWKCHRRFIAAELQKRGWEVIHILEVNRTWVPARRT